jgi:hypothetical protein
MSDEYQKPAKSHKTHGYRLNKAVDLRRVKKKLLTILDRDVSKLMDVSYHNKLSEEEANDLRGYLKLVNNLLAEETELTKNLPEEELSKKLD